MSSLAMCSDDWRDFSSASVEFANLSLRTGRCQEVCYVRLEGNGHASGSKSTKSRSFLSSFAVRLLASMSFSASKEIPGEGPLAGRAKAWCEGRGGADSSVGLEISA